MVGDGAPVGGDMALEVLFDFQRRLAVGEAEPVGNPENVGVHRDDGFVVNNGGNDICRLSADARKCHQRIDVRGDLPAEIGKEFPGHGNQVRGFAVGIGDAADEGIDLVECGGGQGGGIREAFEQGRRDQVHPPVGALGGEDDGDEQLEGVGVMKFGGGEGNVLLKPLQHCAEPFFFPHSQFKINVSMIAQKILISHTNLDVHVFKNVPKYFYKIRK